jgi:ABC-2 type transport system ATP-binding protein
LADTLEFENKIALRNVSLNFEQGKIYGLLGPNGSGKTTLMKVVAGLHKQTSGHVLINDQDLSYKTKTYVSYMPTENYLYPSFKVVDILKFYKDMKDSYPCREPGDDFIIPLLPVPVPPNSALFELNTSM